jgi:hypothetical protein
MRDFYERWYKCIYRVGSQSALTIKRKPNGERNIEKSHQNSKRNDIAGLMDIQLTIAKENAKCKRMQENFGDLNTLCRWLHR